MNQFLAEFYQTGGGVTKEASEAPITDVDALEKMAQLTLLVKQAEEEGVDISGLSDEEALQLADEMYGSDETADPGEQPDTDEVEKEAQAKFEEADFLGRVMAHANWQETQEILKEAGIKEHAGKAWNWAKGVASKARAGTTGKVRSAIEKKLDSGVGERTQRAVHFAGGARQGKDPEKHVLRNLGKKPQSSETWEAGKRRIGGAAEIGTAAAGAAGLGGLTFGGVKGVQALRGDGKKKKAALDTLIEQRAIEHLAAAGYVDQQGNVYAPAQQEQEKTAGDFGAMVDQAALELLEQNGYAVEWNR